MFQVVDPINHMIDTVPFNALAYSLDWHPNDHLSFADNVTKRKLHESSPVRKDGHELWSTLAVFARFLAPELRFVPCREAISSRQEDYL